MAKLTAEQKANIINQYKSWDREWALQTAREIRDTQATPTQTPQTPANPTSSYTEASEFGWFRDGGLRNTQKTTPSNVVETPTTETPTTQETPTKQEETTVSTVPEIQQQGELKPLSQEYYNQTSEEAQAKIINNLNWYKQTNPEYFSDYETFKKNFSYDARNEEQKQTLDTWYKWYTKWMELSWVPVQDLYTQWKDWSISDSDLQNLRISNPTKYAELQDTINKWNIIAAYDDDKWVDGTWLSLQDMAYNMAVQTFNKFMNGDSSSEASQYFRDYEAKMNDPEMLALSDQCTEVQEQMENIQSDLDAIKKSVEEEYAGTWATRSKINAIISDRSYELQLQLRTLNSEYNKYATQYNNRMQQYQNEFSMQLQEYQINQQARQQQMQELGFAMDLMNFETNEQKAQREWDYWVKQQEYQNGNINSKDYQTRYKAALSSVQNLLSQYEGIPMQRSAEQMAQDILKAIDNWSDLWAELTKINQQIQQKPEYKKLYNNTFGGGTWITDTYNIGGQEYVVYDGKIMTADSFNKQFWVWGWAKYNVVSEDALKFWSDGRANTYGSFMSNSKNNDWNYVWECGKFVNNYLQEIWAGRLFGNEDIKTRERWINSDEWKVGTIAVFDYNNYSSDRINHGHVGIVVSAPDKNGDFYVKDANFDKKNPWVIMTRKVNLKDVSLKWFIDPSLDQNGNRWTAGTTATLTNNTTPTVANWKITDAGITQLAKDMLNDEKEYSEIKAAYWEDILQMVENRMLELQNNGFERSTIITDPNKQASMEEKLRKEYDSLVSDAQETIDWVNKMDEAYKLVDTDLNAASQALVIAYNKILDSWSVVREWEYARTAEWQSKLKQIEAKLEQFVNWWAWITKDELASLVKVAKVFSENAIQTQKKARDRAMVSIEKYGLTPEAILPLSVISTEDNTAVEWTENMPLTWWVWWIINTAWWYSFTSSWNNFQ